MDKHVARAMIEPDATTSSLEPTLSDIVWRSAFTLGAGVDAITGGVLSGNALETFDVVPGRSRKTTESMKAIIDFESMRKEMDLATTGQYNIEAVSIDESTKYLSDIRQSALQMTYVAQYDVTDSAYAVAPEGGYVLTGQARRMMRDPDRFRKAYGDYFVASCITGSSFQAVYVLTATSESSLKQFQTSGGVSVEGLFSKDGSAKFESQAAALGLHVEAFVHMVGVADVGGQPAVATPQDVPAALAWFKSNRSGVPQLAKLIHYSALDPAYPRTVGVDPSTFVELHGLYALLWEIRGLYASLPQYYVARFADSFNQFDAGMVANQATLPEDAVLRTKFRDAGDQLFAELMTVRTRQRFHDRVMQARADEPAQGVANKESKSQNHWSYGASASPDPDSIAVYSVVNHWSENAHVGHRSKTVEFCEDPRFLVVGWEVEANWQDGSDGQWEKASACNLLESYAAVSLESRYDRGYDWTVTFHYVDADPYSHF